MVPHAAVQQPPVRYSTYNVRMQSRVARDVRRAQLARFAAMTPSERMAMAKQLGERDLRSYMVNHGVDRQTAVAHVKRAHRAGRRHSSCAADGNR